MDAGLKVLNKEKNSLLRGMWQEMTKYHYNICVFEMKCCVAWQTVTAV